jgi:putative transposase
VETVPDTDLTRELIGFAPERLMDMGVGAAAGATSGEKDPVKAAQRNGYRNGDWGTRAGTVEQPIAMLRKGRHFPGFPEPRWMAQTTLTAVIQETDVLVSPQRRATVPDDQRGCKDYGTRL